MLAAQADKFFAQHTTLVDTVLGEYQLPNGEQTTLPEMVLAVIDWQLRHDERWPEDTDRPAHQYSHQRKRIE